MSSSGPCGNDLERFSGLSFSVAATSPHFIVLKKQSYRIKSRRISTEMSELVHNMSRYLQTVERNESEDHGVFWRFLIVKTRCLKAGGGNSVQDGCTCH